jgi:glycosyltransferase involved in cell wall biosynthesis
MPQKIIVNSINGLRYHERIGFSKTNLIAIPNGIDINRFRHDPDLGNATRFSMGIQRSTFLVGNISRIDPIKALEIFLRAARKFLDKYDDVMFVIVGKGDASYTNKLKKLATALEVSRHLIWVPETRDLVGIYNAFDINTLTSLSEGFPNVVCEAMACGTVCAASDTGDCRQIIADSGFLVNCGNIDGFVDAWETVYLSRATDYHNDLTHKAITKIANQYSLEKMIERTITQLIVNE